MTLTIYHNPRCSKSRETLKLLEEKGLKPDIYLYLEKPLTQAELASILKKLQIDATDLLRTKENMYRELVTKYGEPDDALALSWLSKYPILMERPIVIKGQNARIGRPPEQVLDIL